MSHYNERRRVPRTASPAQARQQQDQGMRPAVDGSADPTELRRALLIYGTAGDAARAGLSEQRAERTH